MTGLTIDTFGGMMPRVGHQQLPRHAASYAKNSLLMSGELRGFRGQLVQADLRDRPYSIQRVYRIPSGGLYEWVTFDDPSIDFVKGPLVNDQWERYYYTSEIDKPRMNTRVRLENQDDGYLLGIPAPTTAPISSFRLIVRNFTGATFPLDIISLTETFPSLWTHLL